MNQAINGVSSQSETAIRWRYPSIAATALGRVAGSLCEMIPAKIWGVKISYLLFALATAPVCVLVYVWIKIFCEKYVLTNRSVQRWASFGSRQLGSVSLDDISSVEVVQYDGQEFYKAADLQLQNAKGDSLMTLQAIQRPEIFRRLILEARDARQQSERALATIEARQSA